VERVPVLSLPTFAFGYYVERHLSPSPRDHEALSVMRLQSLSPQCKRGWNLHGGEGAAIAAMDVDD
jgi:hypothetical protein